MKSKRNLWVLHNLAEAYGGRPSDYLELETPWGRWQVDELALMAGRNMQKQIEDGKNPLPSPTPKTFRSARGLVTKKVKIPASGIW